MASVRVGVALPWTGALCQAGCMSRAPRQPPRWYVISLRPSGEHAPLRRLAAQYGGGLIALSPWRLRTRDDADTRAALDRALAATRALATSPAAARALRELRPDWRASPTQRWYAVGAGTAAALAAAGIAQVRWPRRMDSEGLLDLPELQDLRGEDFALLSAPGGRGLIEQALRARGARVIRADVYERVAQAPSRAQAQRLCALEAPALLALSSGEALQRLLAQLPDAAGAALRRARVSAASPRLAELARGLGFADVAVADGPLPEQLLADGLRPTP